MALFIIEELLPYGHRDASFRIGAEAPARFEWSAAARSIPLRPWTFGVAVRSVRTDYPGADDPTEQVLGPNYTPFTLRGRWDDRYNPLALEDARISGAGNRRATGGYAVLERARFEALVRRANPVRITFEDLTVQGLITAAEFDFRRAWDIGYSFTVSPHHRAPGGRLAMPRSPRGALNAKQLQAEVARPVASARTAFALAPVARLAGDRWTDAGELVDALDAQLAVIDAAIGQRTTGDVSEPGTGLLRLAAAFYGLALIGLDLTTLVAADASDDALDYETPLAMLAFDAWARGLGRAGREVVLAGLRASGEVRRRAMPSAVNLYRPRAGEHLYETSQRFYGTPYQWRRIAARNRLTTTVLAGTELLIIPEVTER